MVGGNTKKHVHMLPDSFKMHTVGFGRSAFSWNSYMGYLFDHRPEKGSAFATLAARRSANSEG